MINNLLINEAVKVANNNGFGVEQEDIKIVQTNEPVENFLEQVPFRKNRKGDIIPHNQENGWLVLENYKKNKTLLVKSINNATYCVVI